MNPKDLIGLISQAGHKPKKCFDGYESRVGVVCDEDNGQDPEAILADVVTQYLGYHSALGMSDVRVAIGFIITRFVRFPIGRGMRYFWQVSWPSDVPDPEEDH